MAGYEITRDDFRRLVSDPYCQPPIAEVLGQWFGYRIEGRDEAAVLRDMEGNLVDEDALHARIQADPAMQNRIYNEAMTLWR